MPIKSQNSHLMNVFCFRQLPPKICNLYERSTMEPEQNTARLPAESVHDQFEAIDNTENEVEVRYLLEIFWIF